MGSKSSGVPFFLTCYTHFIIRSSKKYYIVFYRITVLSRTMPRVLRDLERSKAKAESRNFDGRHDNYDSSDSDEGTESQVNLLQLVGWMVSWVADWMVDWLFRSLV